MNLTLICMSFTVQQITLVYLQNVICRCLVGTKAMQAYILICVKSSGQCSNTYTSCASIEMHSSNIAIAQIKFAPHKHADSTNVYEFLNMSNIHEFSRILKL